jgi:hypothetical protein
LSKLLFIFFFAVEFKKKKKKKKSHSEVVVSPRLEHGIINSFGNGLGFLAHCQKDFNYVNMMMMMMMMMMFT